MICYKNLITWYSWTEPSNLNRQVLLYPWSLRQFWFRS